jgi:hypothetical protein
MDAIAVAPQMTFREYSSCQDALSPKCQRMAIWAFVLLGTGCLAASAAITWGTTASILDGLALAVLAFATLWAGRVRATVRRRIYLKYRDFDTRYTFTNEQISATSRYSETRYTWAAIDRIVETDALYLLTIGHSYIAVTKRSIPFSRSDDFIQLLKTHDPGNAHSPSTSNCEDRLC